MNTRSLLQTKPTSSFTPVSSRLLQRKCACGGSAGLTGKCSECENKRLTLQRRSDDRSESNEVPPVAGKVSSSEIHLGHDFSQVRIYPKMPSMIQPKLQIGQPGDRYEQEADRIADQVMRMPSLTLTPESMLQTQEAAGSPTTITSLNSHTNNLQGSGQTLNSSLRAFFEPRFGYDFSQVRIHTDAQANHLARTVNAQALTMGHNIVFGTEYYSPELPRGKQLLAHELTHVIQQTGGSVARATVQRQLLNITQRFPGIELQRQEDTQLLGDEDTQLLGGKACLDPCEQEFQRCIKISNFPPECIARRSGCISSCPPVRACVISETIPKIKVPVAVSNGEVFMQTEVEIKWEKSKNCDCACGEYRQYVKGHIIIDSKPYKLPLCDGVTLEEDTYHEDGDSSNNFCSGHRDRPENKNDVFDQPNRRTGCHYLGKDQPRVPGREGAVVDVDLKFKGQTYDKCTNEFGQIHEWTFTYKGPLSLPFTP